MACDLVDVAFSQALMEARAGFRGGELRRGAQTVSAPLLAWLRSDRELPDDAGKILAAFFAGDLAASRGRQPVIVESEFATAARSAARAYSRYGAEVKAAARTTTARLLGILPLARLGDGERMLVADFIAGLAHPAGGKTWGVRKNQDDRALAAEILARKDELRKTGVRVGLAEEEAIVAVKADPRAIRRTHSVLKRLMHAGGKIRKVKQRPNVKS